ncbi:MAG TPA: IclR family transcriptional regulator [Candidatus Yaniella excrementigallinarum]|nr:IclR family transcriptional regulator [Candidatus Yaniella excrementigallinarum]
MANSRSGESVVDRIIKVLSAFERAKPRLTVSALARETGLPNSTVHRLATELCDVGFLDRDAQGKVGIGMRMWELAARSNPLEEFRQRGRPVLEGIQEALRHDVSLSVPTYEDFTVLYVERFDKHGTVNNNLANVAKRLDMHCTSAGLAMLANAEHHVLEQFLTGPIPQCTPRTITCPEQLRAQFAEIRERGFSRLAGDLVAENVGYSVPVNGQANKVIGAITVVCAQTEDNPQLIVPVLAAAGRSLSRLMGSGHRPYSARNWSTLK